MDPSILGHGFDIFVKSEYQMFGILTIFFHIATLIILYLVFRHGNKYKRAFAIYFTINWLFLFGYWGVYSIIYWSKIGAEYLASFIFVPILLGLIVFFWIKEIINPKIDLDFTNVRKYRFIVLIITLWGFWYPTYIFGQGFIFNISDLLFSNYGLMPCPTTMVVLSLMTLKYPSGNKILYNLFTVYALFVGTATVSLGWVPDIPFLILGIYSLTLILLNKMERQRTEKLTPYN